MQTYGFFAAPRAYVNFFLTDWLTFKAGVASGLQVPELSTRYDGLYQRSTSSSGVNTDYYGNVNLEVEKSYNYEAGFMINAGVICLSKHARTQLLQRLPKDAKSQLLAEY